MRKHKKMYALTAAMLAAAVSLTACASAPGEREATVTSDSLYVEKVEGPLMDVEADDEE